MKLGQVRSGKVEIRWGEVNLSEVGARSEAYSLTLQRPDTQGFASSFRHFQVWFYDPAGSVTFLMHHEPKHTVIRNQLIFFLAFVNC